MSKLRARWILAVTLSAAGCGALLPPPREPSPPLAPPSEASSATPNAGAPLMPAGSLRAGAWSDADASVPVDSNDPMWGHRTAPVTLVVFVDYECPYCARFERTISDLESRYGPDQLRVVWKNEPLSFHPHARPAAEAAMGVFAMAGADAFWRFSAMAFEGQRDLGRDNLISWALAAGVRDDARFRQGFDAGEWAPKVDSDLALAGALGVRGTPHTFVNGVEISGAQPLEAFADVIGRELIAAAAAVAQGTDPAHVYVIRSLANKGTAAAEPEDEAPDEDTKAVWNVPVGQSPVRGGRAALVTIVEFSDFQCPFCKRGDATLHELTRSYGDSVRVVFKNLPLQFHPRAEPAAELALFALQARGNTGFWAVHDGLFRAQPSLDDESLKSIARAASLDVGKAMEAVQAHRFQSTIDADAELADQVGATGTPTFYINGHRLEGAQPIEAFRSVIDQSLAEAKALVAKGTPATGVYEAVMRAATAPKHLEKKAVEPSTPGSAGAPAR